MHKSILDAFEFHEVEMAFIHLKNSEYCMISAGKVEGLIRKPK